MTLYEVQVTTPKYQTNETDTNRKNMVKLFKDKVIYNKDNPHKPVYIDLIVWLDSGNVETVKTVSIT